MKARLRDQQGFALATAIVLMAAMLATGAALLVVVDVQGHTSVRERQGDSAFNLAEGTLNAAAFVLSRSWPETAVAGQCGSVTSTGTLTAVTLPATTFATRVQNRLYTDFASNSDNTGATWKVNVCDDTSNATSWDSSLLTGAAYDANGSVTTTGARRLWVRAQASVRDGTTGGTRTRAVAGLVQVNQVPALPGKYTLLSGGISTDFTTTTNAVLNNSLTGPLLNSLTGFSKLLSADTVVGSPDASPNGGRVGIRCGLTAGLSCLGSGTLAALSQVDLANLLSAKYVHFRTPTAASSDAIDVFRARAKAAGAAGTYYSTLANGASCLPSTTNTSVVFVEQVGTDGDGTCNISTSSSAPMLVVGSGRVKVTGPASLSATHTVFTGVIYALNNQRLTINDTTQREVVRIENDSKVVGGVYADGSSGRVGVYPLLDLLAIIQTGSPLCPAGLVDTLTCAPLRLLGNALGLNDLLNAFGLSAVVSALTPQISNYTAIEDRASVVSAITTYGSSGTVTGTFRQVPPN